MNILKIIIKGVGMVLNYPLVRHLVAGCAIATAIFLLAIKPLETQNKALREDYNKIVREQSKLIAKLSGKPTYRIENKVDVKKSKEGSNINLVPENTMQTNNVEFKVDSTKETKSKKAGLRFWKKEFWKSKNKK